MASATASSKKRQHVMLATMVGLLGATSGDGANKPMNALRGVSQLEVVGDVASLVARSLETQICVDDIPGIRSSDDGDVCCNARCPLCGGEDCADTGYYDLFETDCCYSSIIDSGVYCDDAREGPCIIGSAPPTCSNGIVGIQSSDGYGNVCCSAECSECGGDGCANYGAGKDNCCVSEIYDKGGLCSTLGEAPCIIYDEEDEYTDWDTGSPTAQPTPSLPSPMPSVIQLTGIVLSPTTPEATPQPQPPAPAYVGGASYIGCFKETGTDPFSSNMEIDDMTPAMCYEECISKGALYMGLIGGNKCSCGEDADYIDSDKTDGECDITCAGEDSICGGMDSFDLYEFYDSTETEITEADMDGNGEIDGYAYKSCNQFEGDTPFDTIIDNDSMTPEVCFELCAVVSARYFGVYNSSECGCGSNTDYIVFGGTPGTCDMACAGDSAYSCGGAEAYDLYQLVDHNIGLDSSHSGGLLECSNGIAGVESQDGVVCCAAACGTCDGSRCVGTGGCCEDYILENEGYCDDKLEAPCII